MVEMDCPHLSLVQLWLEHLLEEVEFISLAQQHLLEELMLAMEILDLLQVLQEME